MRGSCSDGSRKELRQKVKLLAGTCRARRDICLAACREGLPELQVDAVCREPCASVGQQHIYAAQVHACGLCAAPVGTEYRKGFAGGGVGSTITDVMQSQIEAFGG